MNINYPAKIALSLLITCLMVATVYAQSIDKVIKVENQRIKEGQTSQRKIDKLAAKERDALGDYLNVSKIVDGLQLYNELLQKQVDKQQDDITKLQKSIDNVAVIERQIVPLAIRMIDSLERFVAMDVPFLMAERKERIATLKSTMERPDVSVAEKVRKVFEAYQIENEYGRTIESYRGQLSIDNVKREVEFLRIGRLNLLYRSIDGKHLGHWHNSDWQSLPLADYRQHIKLGLKVAAKQVAPDLLTIPLMPPRAPAKLPVKGPANHQQSTVDATTTLEAGHAN